jgi:hypothetical protein
LAEEPHQSLDVLRSRCQEELLPHKLQSPQAQATQPKVDLREQFVYGESMNVETLADAAVSRIAAAIGEPARVRIFEHVLLSERARVP